MQFLSRPKPSRLARFGALALGVAFGGIAHAAPNPAAPNVLFIAVDDLKPSIGAYGDALARTPAMDSLARSGTIFTRAYCQQAVCAASRNSLMTGLRPDSIGIYTLSQHFRTGKQPDVVTLPQHFKNNGYHTESIGKVYHLAQRNHDDARSWSVPSVSGEGKIHPTAPPSAPTAPPASWNRDAPRPQPFSAPDVGDEAFEDGRIAARAIESLGRFKEAKTPFFLALGFTKPHLPFDAPKKYWDLYNESQFQLHPQTAPPAGSPPYAHDNFGELRLYDGIPREGAVPPDLARRLIHGYYASTSYMDAQLGRVLAELDRLKLRDNTVVVLWGDHGFHLSDMGLWCKQDNYERSVRSPLIMSAPQQKKRGQSAAGLVEFVDLYPSLCQLAGLPLPAHLEGTSFVPLLQNPRREWKSAVFHQWPKLERNITLRGMGRAIRTEKWRLVEWEVDPKLGRNAIELYDLSKGDIETKNLASDPQRARLVADLRARLKTGWRGAVPRLQ